MSDQPTQLEFLEHVKNHELAVLFESPDGDYRHIRLRQPSSGNQYFDLITWPGHLCYTGDMGTYVFTRLRDMFEFFRDKGEGELKINPGYWDEKVLGDSRYGKGCEEWSDEKFKKVVTDRWEEHFGETKPEEPDPDDSDEGDLEAYHQELKEWARQKQWAMDEIEEEIFCCDDLEHEGFRAANAFDSQGLTFDDLWDNNFMEYTYHYIWACYAIVWGIRQWDNRPPKLGKAYKYVSRCGTELFVPASLWRFDPFKLFGLVPELVEVIAGMPLMTKEQMDHIYKVNACRPGMVNFLSTGQEDLKLETFMVGGLGAGAEGTMTKADVRIFLASAPDLTPDATKS
jgi:hypothetical protein